MRVIMTAMTPAERQATRREREKAAGLIRLTVTIPKARKTELKAILAQWREEIGC
jgi:hypothetical protein